MANGNFYSTMAYISHITNKTDKAMKYYKKSISKGNLMPRTYSGYTSLLIKLGRYDEAYNVITTALKELPVNPKAKIAIQGLASQYVIVLWKMGKIDEAVTEMEKVHQELPSVNSYGTLGYLYIEQGDKNGDYTKALEFNEKAKAYADDDANILDNMGQVMFRLGRYDEAIENFEAALTENPTQSVTLYYMARIHVIKGNYDKALNIVNSLVNKDISNTATVSKEDILALKKEIEEKMANI
ncbi:MAG: tetratricopeptide repeat protein [Clostridiales bacterium]|nr:tetratricopeptide repeat protein [Clostridiales bacterium]